MTDLPDCVGLGPAHENFRSGIVGKPSRTRDRVKQRHCASGLKRQRILHFPDDGYWPAAVLDNRNRYDRLDQDIFINKGIVMLFSSCTGYRPAA